MASVCAVSAKNRRPLFRVLFVREETKCVFISRQNATRIHTVKTVYMSFKNVRKLKCCS